MNEMTYKWSLKNTKFKKNKGKVFTCFSGGGGSSMGYYNAGFDVIGNLEIDKKMNECYVKNLNPKYNYEMDIRDFNKLDNLPSELFELDILDGSPPCSTFSVSGGREKTWGVEKKFAEGQKLQTLDDLFFHFIGTAAKLKPKIVIAENVKGLIIGSAKKYVIKIIKEFEKIGYSVTIKLVKGHKLGLPQKRERIFFIAVRNDLKYNKNLFTGEPIIDLYFNEKPVKFKEIYSKDGGGKTIGEGKIKNLWNNRELGASLDIINLKLYNKVGLFNLKFAEFDKVLYTLTSCETVILKTEPRYINNTEIILASSFPMDYDFCNKKVEYVCGMSVPPLMIYKVVNEVYNQIMVNL